MSEKKNKYTIVKGIRATPQQFVKWSKVAKAEGLNRNKLIVKVMENYCKKVRNDGNP